MDGPGTLGKTLVVAGLVLVAVGLLVLLGGKVGLGRLPGDLSWKSDRVSFYVPLATSLLLSAIVTLALFVVQWLRRT